MFFVSLIKFLFFALIGWAKIQTQLTVFENFNTAKIKNRNSLFTLTLL